MYYFTSEQRTFFLFSSIYILTNNLIFNLFQQHYLYCFTFFLDLGGFTFNFTDYSTLSYFISFSTGFSLLQEIVYISNYIIDI
jgi:hypothetical protein